MPIEPLKVDGTEETPFVHLDKMNNFFEISGNSYPEDATAFYKPIIQWMVDYSNSPNETTHVTFNFIYFNSASYKSIYDMIYLLEELRQKKGVEIRINWFYKEGDIDIREIGEGLAETIKIPFLISPEK